MDPVMDRLIENSQDIDHLKQEVASSNLKIEEIKDTIFETNGKLDIFEQINLRMAEQKADVLTLEEQLKYQVKTLTDKMKDTSE